ncbi:MAG: hypothetical protein ABFC84_14725 [Veillonellales bacterium]
MKYKKIIQGNRIEKVRLSWMLKIREGEQMKCPICGENCDDNREVCPSCAEKMAANDKKIARANKAIKVIAYLMALLLLPFITIPGTIIYYGIRWNKRRKMNQTDPGKITANEKSLLKKQKSPL